MLTRIAARPPLVSHFPASRRRKSRYERFWGIAFVVAVILIIKLSITPYGETTEIEGKIRTLKNQYQSLAYENAELQYKITQSTNLIKLRERAFEVGLQPVKSPIYVGVFPSKELPDAARQVFVNN